MIMEFLMKPGIRMKRWIFLGFVGVVILVLGVVEIFSNKDYNGTIRVLYLFLSLIGILIMYIAFSEFVKSFISLINSEKVKITINDKNIEELVDEKRVHVGGPKVVVIGGGIADEYQREHGTKRTETAKSLCCPQPSFQRQRTAGRGM